MSARQHELLHYYTARGEQRQRHDVCGEVPLKLAFGFRRMCIVVLVAHTLSQIFQGM